MSNGTTETKVVKPVKMMPPLGVKRTFLTLFIALVVVNFAIITVATTYGWTEGYNGTPGFSWERLGAVIGGMFGDTIGFFSVVGGIVVLAAIWWASSRLARAGWHKTAGLLVVVALILGMLLALAGAVSLDIITFGFLPFLIFLIGTAVEAALLTALLANPLRWKRGTN